MKEIQRSSIKPIVLTIAGFDPSSGAGLTADIRTFENIGIYGMSICTAITIQNAELVKEWIPIKTEDIKKQLDIIFSSYSEEIKVVKTGMLGTVETVNLVLDYHQKYKFDLVVDPVIYSGSGMKLAEDEVEKAIKEKLFPIATVIIPNKFEAEQLSGKNIDESNTLQSIQDICTNLKTLGPKNIILKGGHIQIDENKIADYLFCDKFFRYYPRERTEIGDITHIHGTGCVFSSLIAGFLALGYNIEECVLFSEDYIEKAFEKLFPLKQGAVLDIGYNEEEIDVLKAVQKVVGFICNNPNFSKFIPEVRSNVAISKSNAKNLNEIAAVDGRITVVGGIPVAAGPIKFGASNHTGRLILEAKKYDNSVNAVINIKYSSELIKKLEGTNLSLININRLKQTRELSEKENSTMGWIVRQSFKELNSIPDIIWDSGEPEKEPMIRLFAKHALDLINKIKIILEC
ncbi:MAG: bifunctional hydroxymethylpyrimidine kinase/phosphomethylpyrimidine kinase [archaeon]|nr:bifunctional hydroxymethylpyrimidine kinase/phosphomethylpyrimidine kinase [archaeon]